MQRLFLFTFTLFISMHLFGAEQTRFTMDPKETILSRIDALSNKEAVSLLKNTVLREYIPRYFGSKKIVISPGNAEATVNFFFANVLEQIVISFYDQHYEDNVKHTLTNSDEITNSLEQLQLVKVKERAAYLQAIEAIKPTIYEVIFNQEQLVQIPAYAKAKADRESLSITVASYQEFEARRKALSDEKAYFLQQIGIADFFALHGAPGKKITFESPETVTRYINRYIENYWLNIKKKKRENYDKLMATDEGKQMVSDFIQSEDGKTEKITNQEDYFNFLEQKERDKYYAEVAQCKTAIYDILDPEVGQKIPEYRKLTGQQ